jgi:metal-responsive CopG/Arc/MetJ family transcriptional regulator
LAALGRQQVTIVTVSPAQDFDDINPNPGISLETDMPDIDPSLTLPQMPTLDQIEQLGIVPIHPEVSLDTQINHTVHFLSEAKGEPVTIRLSPQLSQLVDRLIHARSTGYRTKSEFFRDAAYHLARALCQLHNIQDPRLVSYLISAEAAAQADFESRLRDQIQDAEHKFTDYLLAVVERGGLAEAIRAIDAHENTARRIPIDWWRNRWLSTLYNSPLVKQIRAAHIALTVPRTTTAPQAV